MPNFGDGENGKAVPTRNLLDDLDRELARGGYRFVRYADDCNIYVRSERAGHACWTT